MTVLGREILRAMLVLAAALAVGFIVTALVSHEPLKAYRALLTGALPEFARGADGGWAVRRVTRMGAVLEEAITLTFVGLAVAIPFQARQFSIGADGQVFLGALAAAAVSLAIGGPPFVVIPAACLAAMTAGFLWGLVPGLLKARFDANEIVTTLMLNIVAVQIYRLVIMDLMNDPAAGFLTTPALPLPSVLQVMIARTNVTAMLLWAPVAAFAAWLLMRRTTLGFEIRLMGENPLFAARAGVPIIRTTVLSIALGGVFAGLAGFHISNALLKRLPVDLNPGIGFSGIVVALIARNNPLAVPFAALAYAYLQVGAQVMERTSDVSREMVLILQALIVLFVASDRFGPRLHAFRRTRPFRRRAA